MAEEITYIPYGQDEISQQDLMTSLADGVSGYLDSKRWAKKDKYRQAWLNAYQDIMGHGLLGASNSSGLWNLQYGQEPIDLSTKSNIEREMYQDAAYYIQQQMSQMPLHKKEEEKKKEDLEKYGNFGTNLMNQILKGYGNNSELFKDSEQGWDAQDARGTNGLRGTKNRKDAMIKALSAYKDSLNDKDYNFEETPFKDKADLQTKIQAAIDALNTDEETDDLPAFNALGLPYRAFFNNGGNDPYTKGDYTGTYSGYNEYLAEQNKAKQKAEQEKLKQQRANQYTNFRFYGQGLAGTPPSGEDALQRLNTYASLSKLNGNQQSELVGAFRFAEKNGILQNLSKEELQKFGSRWMSNPSRLKKINGLNGFYWDSVGQRVVQPYNQSNVPTAGFQDLINQNSPEALAQEQELENQKKIQQANNRKLSDGFEAEDYLRMGAMAQDITGAVAAWVPYYGTAISGGLGLGSLATNFIADWNDDSVTVGDMLKNAGINAGLAAVGMVPGLGLAAKSGKWLANIAKWTPRILTLASAGHIALSDDIKNSLKKASSVSDWNKLTNQDVKNITYALSTVAGLSRGAKGIVNNRKFKPITTQNTETKSYIVTKSGKRIEATQEQVNAINKAGRKGGNAKANEELQKLPGAKNEEVNINFKTGIKGKADLTNRIKLEHSTKNIGQSPEVQRYSRALSIKNARVKAQHPILSKFFHTDYDIYKGASTLNFPSLNVVDRLKQAWNPVSNRPFKGKQQSSTPTSTSANTPTKTSTGSNAKPKQSVLSKAESQELKSTLQAKNFSTNEFKDESRVVGSIKGFGDLYGIRNSDGTHTLQIDFGGTRVNVTGTKADIKGKTLEVLKKDIMKKIDSQIPKEKRSRIKFDLISKLKQEGYLKQGGRINSCIDTVIKDFFKNNNI